MAKVIKELSGHSGSSIFLLEQDGNRYIFKQNNVARNYERLTALSGIVNVPKLWNYKKDSLCMEYIHGLDMKTYLRFNTPNALINFITESIDRFRQKEIDKDYTDVYSTALSWMDKDTTFPFTKRELIDKLPKLLPQSTYHGDMTLENIIQRTDDKFFFIDAVTVPYDSWVFDLAKMRQDLECKWFLRNDTLMLDAKLKNIQNVLLNKYPIANSDYFLILMLLRVYLHCNKNTLEYNFIVNSITKIWNKNRGS